MSNLSGNYKINAGEVQGVDVVREQERRARLQLLDEIREPSPQPIFGEPVKVELEDETSRRIKNTLGDFTQVLINDSKSLLGIVRSSSSSSASTSGHGGPQSCRSQPTPKRPPIQNGMYKPPVTNIPKHPASDKRPAYPRHKLHEPINCLPTSLYTDSRLKDQWERSHMRKPGALPSSNGSFQSGLNNPSYISANPSLCPNPSNVPSNKTYHIHNGMVSNTAVQAPRYGESSSSAPPPKRCTFRPSTLKLPERKPEKPVESPKRDHELETILREMKQAVPPPLTAIQTPRTEENGFPFPDEPKVEDLLNIIEETKLNTFVVKTPDVVPQPPEPPKQKEGNSRQNTPSPLLKKSDIHMPPVVDSLNKLDPGRKEPEIYKCISSSLQADLEMSESDDEVVTEAKGTEAKINSDISVVEYPKSPVKTSSVNSINSSTVVNSNMDVPQSVPSNSSSSESGDSDSDDSSSDSNDSDSSASTEASDTDTPSKMWGLSNFFDESRRNHSPAFIPLDTSTNSSTNAVKEEPALVPQVAKGSYSLVNAAHPVNGVLRDPIRKNIPKFLELDSSVNIKNEKLSPIASPMHPPGPPSTLPPPSLPPPPPPPPIQTIRGPRTPPSPSYSGTDELMTVNRNCALSGNVQTETSVNVELTVPQSQTNKHSVAPQNSCDTREESGKVQVTTAKKRLSKNKTEIFSPRNDSSPVTQSFEDDEPSASNGLSDASLDKVENILAALTTCKSVPSETSESSHENYSIKTRQKVLKSSTVKKSKTLTEESLCESGQKGNNLSKPVAPKFKHPTRTCRASNDTKQLSKAVKGSTKLDQSEGVKKSLVKSDVKDKSNSEKSKSLHKTVENLKGPPKNAVKIKKKPPKMPPKQVTDGKKGEVKRKKSKFHIENFLQSPTVSQSVSDLLPKISSISPSRGRSPIPDHKCLTDSKRKPSISPARASRSPSRSSSKSVERVKGVEKLRRSTRCSERASSIAQAESSAAANQDSDLAKKSAKRTPKLKEHADKPPINVEAPPSLLSPIPHVSPIPTTSSECAIPIKIMVSIPLDKLTRLPAAVHAHDSENKPVSKRSRQAADETTQKKDSMLLEKSKNVTNKRSVSKDIKDKPRTDPNAKNNKSSKGGVVSKKDKNIKAVIEPSLPVKSKTSSNVNNKTSIKTADGKSSWDSSENKVSKKRKSEESKQTPQKKPKTYPEDQDKIQLTSLKLESPSNNPNASTSKCKDLERCDSVSSLSSLSSQRSQRSSKGKRSSTMSDAKRGKASCLPVKHIKQEKEEKIKTTIKKEPGTPDKSKEKSRDKLLSKDADCNEKNVDPMWNDTSSQYSPLCDTCKDDSKGSLPITSALLEMNRVCGLEWDGVDIKDIKERPNLKNNHPPMMPMDYYYTEARKQKQLAEKETDPFLKSLKYFEATVLFILTSQQREEYTKEPESVYQFYRETLNFSNAIFENVQLQHSSPGSVEFILLILTLRCQALLHVKLYNLRIKEIKEQQKCVSDFFFLNCPTVVQSLTHPTPSNPKMSLMSIPSPRSPTPSPASSVNSQTSGYSSSDVSSSHRNSLSFSSSVNVSQSTLETLSRHHTHLINLHMSHDLWEQADMYMTRSNLREFFKEVADQSENLTLHSSIKDLVNYVQTGITLMKKCSR